MKLKETYKVESDGKKLISKREFELTRQELEDILEDHCINVMLKMNPETGILDPKINIRYILIGGGDPKNTIVVEQHFEYRD